MLNKYRNMQREYYKEEYNSICGASVQLYSLRNLDYKILCDVLLTNHGRHVPTIREPFLYFTDTLYQMKRIREFYPQWLPPKQLARDVSFSYD
jgi:hypothetical protein